MLHRLCAACCLLPALAGVAAFAFEELLLDVPYVAQPKDGCGAAVAAMVIEYWASKQGKPVEVNVNSLHQTLYSRGARGSFASALAASLEKHGFATHAFRGEWADLEHHVRRGRPLIVALKPRGGSLHYVVATGIDAANGIVLKHDPAVRKFVKQRREEFEREWKGANYWTLLALPEP